jgi:hypothetical protein
MDTKEYLDMAKRKAGTMDFGPEEETKQEGFSMTPREPMIDGSLDEE